MTDTRHSIFARILHRIFTLTTQSKQHCLALCPNRCSLFVYHVPLYPYFFTLKMEAMNSSEIPVTACQATWHQVSGR
jgi:hypothetical protein